MTYCPVHEYDWMECNEACQLLKQALRQIDRALRAYWKWKGYRFSARGRSA